MQIKIGNRFIGDSHPAFLIAEIGSNFDGDMDRAKKLIRDAKDCGADAVKFQSFKASTIICPKGFRNRSGFQAKWGKSVEDVYKAAEFPREWHGELMDYAKSLDLIWFSAPYDFEAVDILEGLGVDLYKVGSGDITWLEMLEYIAKKNKPIILGTGASTLAEVDEAVRTIESAGNEQIILLQCVTNYPAHFEDANVAAIKTFRQTFGCLTGYSDHTPGSVVPLATIALGGCVIEKHFTDDKKRIGPDHPYAMDLNDFRQMSESIRHLELAMGSPYKNLYPEETDTVVLQRRCIRLSKDIKKGDNLTRENLTILRPAPEDSIYPKYIQQVIGKVVKEDLEEGDYLRWDHL